MPSASRERSASLELAGVVIKNVQLEHRPRKETIVVAFRIVMVCVGLLCMVTTVLADEKAATVAQTIDFDTPEIDIRDALLQAAATAKTSIVIAPAIKGPLTIRAKKVDPGASLRVLAAAVGCVIVPCGEVSVVVEGKRKSRPLRNTISSNTSKKTKARSSRKASVRKELAAIAHTVELPIVVGRDVNQLCPLHVTEVPVVDLFEALIWANELEWTVLDEMIFVGTAASVKAAKHCFEAQKR